MSIKGIESVSKADSIPFILSVKSVIIVTYYFLFHTVIS